MNKVGFSSEKMNWRTPPSVFNWFDKTLRFTLDAAASPDNALCVDYLTQAFEQDWGTHQSVWINPPYGRYGMERWLEKAHAEAQKGKVVACLIFARTDTRWWHDWAMKASVIHLIKGRIKFLHEDGEPRQSATAPSCLVVFSKGFGPPRFVSTTIPKDKQ